MPNTIAENLQRLVAAKSAIANAITAKGGTVTVGDGLEDFVADIATIPSSDIEQLEPYDFPDDILETPADYDITVCLKYETTDIIVLLFSVARKQTKNGALSFKLDIGAHGNKIIDTKVWGSGSGTAYSTPTYGSCNITDSGSVLTIKASSNSSISSPKYQLLSGVVLWLKQ